MARVRVGTPCAFACGDDATDDTRPQTQVASVSSSPRAATEIVGVFADHLVTHDRSTNQLQFRSIAEPNASPVTHNAATNRPTHMIHAPDNVRLPRRNGQSARFAVMWRRNHDDRVVMHSDTDLTPRLSVWLVDLKNKSTTSIACDSFSGIDRGGVIDGFVDTNGTTIALVDASRTRLWCWTASANTTEDNCAADPSERQGEWTMHDLPSSRLGDDYSTVQKDGLKTVRACCGGRFVCSSLLGRCFLLIQVEWDLRGTIRLEKWTLDVELNFQLIQYASMVTPVAELPDTVKGASSRQKPLVLQLRMNSSWSHAAIAVQNTLVVVPVASDLGRGKSCRTTRSLSIEQDIVDVAWVDERSTLALLVSHGQVLMISLSERSGLEPLDVETQSTTSKRLSLSALMNRAVSSASHVIWIESIKKIMIPCGGSVILFPVEVSQSSPALLQSQNASLKTITSNDRDSFRQKRRRQRNETNMTRVDEKLRNHLEHTPSPSALVLVHIARLALYESDTTCVQDVFFTLVSIVFQQVKSASNMVFDDRRLIEGLLSLIISMEPRLRHRIGAKILAAPPAFSSRVERRAYYHKEMSDLAQICQSIRQTDSQAPASASRVAATVSFFQVYLPSIMDQICELTFESELVGGQSVLQSLSFCQRMGENQFGAVLAEAEKASHTKRLNLGADDISVRGSAARDSLLLIVLAYAMTCTSLRIDSVMLDLPHIVSLAKLRGKDIRKEQLICFATLVNDTPAQDFLSIHSRTATPSWNLEKAFIFARKTQTLELLVDFCTTSKSAFAHECLKELFTHQSKLFLNSKSILFDERVASTRQFEALHLHVCETYLGELIGILRELPLVLEFKRPSNGTEAVHSDALGCSKGIIIQAFDMYTKYLVSGLDDIASEFPATVQDKNKTTSQNRFWTHASRESRARSRCFKLKSRIVWHLKQLLTSYKQSLLDIFDRVFLIDFLSGRCGNPEEAKLITKFVDKAQDAVSCERWYHTRLSFDNYQQRPTRSRSGNPSHFRVDKIVRTLAMAIWAMWIRERCAYCLRSIELLKRHEELTRAQHIGEEEKKQIGSIAATCALQLNVPGILVGKTDDVFALQISLLEEAAKLNSSKATAVVCWAFPADKIQARYLKRYKALRAALKAESDGSLDGQPIEETEHRYQFIQRHVKKSIRWNLTSGSMKAESTYPESPKKHEITRSWTSEIDALVDCCCDLEFQKTTWALIQKRFVGGSKALIHDGDKSEMNKDQLNKLLLKSRPSTVDGFISRQEVMLLLQEQKRELEGKVESLSRTPEGDNELSAEPLPAKITKPSSQSTSPSSLEQVPAKAIASVDKSYMIREILQDEDDSENPKRKCKLPQQTDRRESVQNVLKLLNLRKQPGIHTMDSVPNLVVSTGAQRSQSQRSAVKVPEGIASSDNTSSPKRHAQDTTLRRAMSFATNDSMGIREQQPDQSVTLATRIPSETPSTLERPPTHVFPLQYDHDMGASSLKLLDPNSTKPISLKTKKFTFQEREVRGATWSAVRKVTLSGGNIADATSLRTASSQTEKADQEQAPEVEQGKPNFEQQWIKVPVAKDSETQSKIEESDTKDTQEASIQCKFQEKAAQEFQKTASDEDTSRLLRKYPVFVDLEPKSNSERSTQRYLQVVRCAKHNGQGSSASEASRVAILREIGPNDAILFKESTTPEKAAVVSLGEHITPSETATDGHPLVLSEKEIQAHEHDHDPGRLRSLRSLYRSHSRDEQTASLEMQKSARESDRERLRSLQELYRNHFIVSSSPAADLPKSDEKRKVSISSGRHSLLGLKEDMERMNTRLAHLEHCANEIDEDFKDSHHKLDRMGQGFDRRHQTAQQRFLGTVADALEGSSDQKTTATVMGKTTAASAFSKKATESIVEAKKLMDRIEKLALGDDERTAR